MLGVVHVMGRMAPGGTENQLVGMLEAAHGKLWNATLCVLSGGHALAERVRAAGVPVVELDGAGRADPRRVLPFRSLTLQAEVIHSSLWGANAFSRLATLGHRRPPVVISERGVETNRRRAQRALDRALAPITAGFIGNSPAVVDFISTWHGVEREDPRLVEIRNGLDSQIFHSRGRYGRNGVVKRIVTVGRLVPDKRVELIIDLLAEVRERAQVELIILGDGPERGRLAELSDGLPVRFFGHVDQREELATLLRSAHVLAMPSKTEGLPNAVIEALACGLKVVASDIPGIRPLAGPGVSLVPDDRSEWVDALVGAVESGPVDTSVPHDSIRSFELVAKEHLAVFEHAVDTFGGEMK